MSMSYNKIYRVPVWVLLQKMKRSSKNAVKQWLLNAGARQQDWPANSYPEALFAYRNKGYAHALPQYPFVLEPNLMIRSAAEHIKNTLGPTSYMAGSVSVPVSRIDRSATKDEDLVTIFNDLLSLEDPIALSQMFQVAENCHRDSSSNSVAWFTVGPAPKSLLTRIADRVITIGDEPNNDFVVGGLAKDDLASSLEQFFSSVKS